MLLLFLFYKGRKKSFGKRKVFLEGKKILGLYRLLGSEGGVDRHTQKKTDWRGGSRTHGPRIFEIFVTVLFEGDGIKHASNCDMAEARRQLELEGGRTGFGDPVTIMVAGALGVGAARLTFNNSKRVRDLVGAAKNRWGKKLPQGELVLPFNWERRHTKDGMIFYNSKTHETSNTPPTDSYEEHTGEDGKLYWHSDGLNKTVFVRPGGPAPPPAPPDHNALPTNWTEHEDNGQKFYHNALTGVSQHERPTATPAVVHPPHAVVHPPPAVHHPPANDPVFTPRVAAVSNKKRGNYNASKAKPQATPGTQLDATKQANGKKGKNIFPFPQETHLHSNIKSAVSNLEMRGPGLIQFFQKHLIDNYYTGKIAKLDRLTIDALKVMGSKKKPQVTYLGDDKRELLTQLVQAEKDADKEKVGILIKALYDAKVAVDILTRNIETARTNESEDIKTIFEPVTTSIQVLDQKLKAVRVTLGVLKNTMEQFDKVCYQSTNGLLAACQAAVLAYSAKLKTKKDSFRGKK